MGIFNIFRVFASVAVISLVAVPAYSQNKWDVSRPSLTTEYYVLKEERIPMRPPPAGRDVMVIDRATTSNSSYTIPRGGEQTIQQRGTIEAVNKSTTIKGRFKWTNFQVSNGFKAMWRASKITPQSLIAGFIIERVANEGIDWVFDYDSGKVYTVTDKEYLKGGDTSYYGFEVSGSSGQFANNALEACSLRYPEGYIRIPILGDCELNGSYRIRDGRNLDGMCNLPNGRENSGLCGFVQNKGSCPDGYQFDDLGCYIAGGKEEVSASELDAFFDSIIPEEIPVGAFDEMIKADVLDPPLDFVISSIDPVVGDTVETITKDDLTGEEVIIKDTPSYDFSISNDNGNPVVSGSTINNQEIYVNGSLSGSTTTTTTAPPYDGTQVDKPDNPLSDFEECLYLPESCLYYEYMKEDFKEPSSDPDYGFEDIDMGDIDVSSLFEYDFNLNVPDSCPLPYVLDMGIFGTTEVSFDHLCSVANSARPFVVSSAIIASLFMLLGSARKM